MRIVNLAHFRGKPRVVHSLRNRKQLLGRVLTLSG